MERSCQLHGLLLYPRGESPGTFCIGAYVDPTVGPEIMET
jgi:hypothetical protein